MAGAVQHRRGLDVIMKYVITVMKASGTRKVLETHEFKGAI